MTFTTIVKTSLLLLPLILPATALAETSSGDAKFLKKAAQAGHFEVEGSKLALGKSRDADVQKFAKQMVEDHTKAGNELKTLAQAKRVELPTRPNFMQKGTLTLLDTYNAKNFDEEYSENVGVEAHESTIELFEKAAKDAEDPEIKQFAVKTLPALKHHYEMAKQLDKKFD